MKRLAIICLVLVAALPAACGDPSGAPRSPGAQPPSSPSPSPSRSYDPDDPVTSGPLDPSPPSGPGYELVEPRPGMEDLRAVPFEKARPSAHGRTLTVVYWSGVEPCTVLDSVEVEETGDEVTITLFEGSDPQMQNVACIEIALKKAVKVELEEPLGDRKVVDGAKP